MIKIKVQLFGGRGVGSGKIYLDIGKQGKHFTWHNNYREGKSIVTIRPERIRDLVKKYTNKKHGQREYIDFEEPIGKWYNINDGKYYDTTRGTLHWAKDGGYHIVPAPPVGWNK